MIYCCCEGLFVPLVLPSGPSQGQRSAQGTDGHRGGEGPGAHAVLVGMRQGQSKAPSHPTSAVRSPQASLLPSIPSPEHPSSRHAGEPGTAGDTQLTLLLHPEGLRVQTALTRALDYTGVKTPFGGTGCWSRGWELLIAKVTDTVAITALNLSL